MVQIAPTDGGAHAPQVFCDRCGERIFRAEEGVYGWFPDPGADEEQTYNPFFIHDFCTGEFEMEYGEWSHGGDLVEFLTLIGRGLDLG